MKRIILLFSLLYICSLNGYSYNKINDIKNYLKNNILTLDPLEGLYDVEFSKQGQNAFQAFPPDKERFKLYIKKNSKGELEIIRQDTGDIFNWEIERIGDSNVYNFTVQWEYVSPTTERVYLNNNIEFTFNYEIPIEEMKKAMGRDYQSGFRVYLAWNFIKTYPTSSMYAEAIKNKEQECAQPKEWTGSGFALLEGYLVTNYHVIENAKSIIVQSGSDVFSNKKTATIIGTDKVNDLALLKIQGDITTYTLPYSVKTFTSDVGEDVWVLGFPLTSTMGDEIKLTTGVISAKSGYEGDVSMYQISAPIQPGNSGGPVFDGKGNLIGVVCAHHLGAENVGYAIKSLYLRNLIESYVNHDIMPHETRISGKTLAEQVKAVKDYIYYITCSN